MTSFQFDVGSRARKAGRFIGRVRSELLKALSDKKAKDGLTQQALATKLGVHRSLVNRQLSGESNLTLRSLADLAWAMDMELNFELRERAEAFGQNESTATSTISHGQIRFINGRSGTGANGQSAHAPNQPEPRAEQ